MQESTGTLTTSVVPDTGTQTSSSNRWETPSPERAPEPETLQEFPLSLYFVLGAASQRLLSASEGHRGPDSNSSGWRHGLEHVIEVEVAKVSGFPHQHCEQACESGLPQLFRKSVARLRGT